MVGARKWQTMVAENEDLKTRLEAVGKDQLEMVERYYAMTRRVEQTEIRAERAEAALGQLLMAFDEHVALPDRNCSCHLAPPCGDCETYSFAREAHAEAKALIEGKST